MLIYVKDSVANESYLIMLKQGTGDKLFGKDIKDGYVGYVNYYIVRFTGHYGDDNEFHFYDCGLYLCTQEEFRHIEQGNMEYLLDKIISYIFAGGLHNIELPDGVTYKIVDKELEV